MTRLWDKLEIEKKIFQRDSTSVSLPDLELSWKFLSKVTQALVLSVFELTMPPSDDDSDIFECTKAATKTTTTDRLNDIQNNFTESAEKTKSENHQEDSEKVVMKIKNYQPNHGGVQINIENLHVNDLNVVDAKGISQKNPDQSEFGPKNEDVTFLMQDEEGVENPLMQIIRKYFGKTRTNSKQMRNSPMMIKLLKKEL